MDNLIVAVVRFLSALAAILGVWSIRLGERIKVWQQQHRTAASGPPIKGAAGVPAVAARPAHRPISMPAAKHAGMPEVVAQTAAASPAIATTTPPPPPFAGDVPPDRQPDELDWAGSLNHAAVASLHLGGVLAMVRAGWLVPDETHLADVSAALDAMEAFHVRTDDVIARVLATLPPEQQAEFFDGFGEGFPPELPGLEDSNG